MAAGNPPPKPWQRAGASSCPAPFNSPSGGSCTFDVVEASGTAKHGEIVSDTMNRVASNVKYSISWSWQQGSYEGYGSSMYSCYRGLMYSGGTGGSCGGHGSISPPKAWEHPGASYRPAPFKPPSAGKISDLAEALGIAEHGEVFSATWNSIVSDANNDISTPVPQGDGSSEAMEIFMGAVSHHQKPWERVGASYGPFKPPSAGSTIDVVEASGTEEHGGIVSGTWNNIAYNVNSITSRPVPPRLWLQRGYGKFYGRLWSKVAHCITVERAGRMVFMVWAWVLTIREFGPPAPFLVVRSCRMNRIVGTYSIKSSSLGDATVIINPQP